MSANVAPIFSASGNVGFSATGGTSAITAAANDFTGVSANYQVVFTAGANGSFIERLRLKAVGTNVAAVMRVFINNNSSSATASNNEFYGEVTLPATTLSTTSGTIDVDYPMGFVLPANYKIIVGLGAAVAAGWVVVGVGGNY